MRNKQKFSPAFVLNFKFITQLFGGGDKNRGEMAIWQTVSQFVCHAWEHVLTCPVGRRCLVFGGLFGQINIWNPHIGPSENMLFSLMALGGTLYEYVIKWGFIQLPCFFFFCPLIWSKHNRHLEVGITRHPMMWYYLNTILKMWH